MCQLQICQGTGNQRSFFPLALHRDKKYRGRVASGVIPVLFCAWFLLAGAFTLQAAAPPIANDPVHEGRPLSEWLSDLSNDRDRDQNKQNLALEAVRKIGTNGLPMLLQKLQFKAAGDLRATLASRSQARMAFEALGPQAKPAVPQLIALLKDEVFVSGADTALVAAAALKAIGADSIPALKSAMASRLPADRYGAALALGFFNSNPRDVVPLLITALKDSDRRVRARAATSLGEIPGEENLVIPALTAALSDSAAPVRLEAVGALRQSGTAAKSAIPALVTLTVKDPDDTIRFNAGQTLPVVGPEEAVTALAEHLKKEETFAAAARALGRFGTRADSTIPALLRGFKMFNRECAAAAGFALRAIGPRALRPLSQYLTDADPEIRFMTVRTIGLFGQEAKSLIPALTQATQDSEEAVRDAAIATLHDLATGPQNP